jgi:hypothetical protein
MGEDLVADRTGAYGRRTTTLPPSEPGRGFAGKWLRLCVRSAHTTGPLLFQTGDELVPHRERRFRPGDTLEYNSLVAGPASGRLGADTAERVNPSLPTNFESINESVAKPPPFHDLNFAQRRFVGAGFQKDFSAHCLWKA